VRTAGLVGDCRLGDTIEASGFLCLGAGLFHGIFTVSASASHPVPPR